MPDDNRFSGLGDKLGDGESDDDTTAEQQGTPDESSMPTAAIDEPAFDFDAAVQRPLYARSEAWDAIEDTLELDVERELRTEHDVRNASKRELHDALLQVAAEHAEEIADQVVTERTD